MLTRDSRVIGERLGQYRIEERLGAGGMGVVYRAYDERLHRPVGIKLLGEVTGTTPEERTRLLDEARAASHLAHPHICTIYEVADTGTHAFIVMEYVEGRPLSQLIPHDGLPFEQVVRYGTQIAGAIAHAHERGVVHRDLKTSNVVISPHAGAKVLDFGLAHRLEIDGGHEQTRTVAEAAGLTGTPAYLAPEVLVGSPSTTTSDIWALGVVLYEMANGELPFMGRNQIELTASIITAPTQPFSTRVPASMRAIILHCLEKEPARRYQRAGEVRAALEAISTGEVVSAVPQPTSARRSLGLAAVALLALIVMVGGVALWKWRTRTPSSRPVAVAGGQLVRLIESEDRAFDPNLSPDGRTIYYVVEDHNGRRDVFTTRVAGGGRIALTNDDALEAEPVVSPDGEWVAYTRRERADLLPQIRIVPALGGDVRATIPSAAAPAWSPDGERLVFLRQQSDGSTDLVSARVDGADPRVLLKSDGRYPFLRHPAWSSDGRTIAVVRGTGGVAGEIWVVPAEGGEPRRPLTESGSSYSESPIFTPDGTGIIHTSNRGGAVNVWLLPLTGGEPVRLTTGTGPDQSPTVAADGSIAFVNSRWRNTLDVFDLASGKSQTLFTHTPYLWGPTVSPDNKEIAFSRGEVDGTWQLWTVPVEGGTPRRLTTGDAGAVYARYSPDGTSIFFHTWSPPRQIGRVPRGGGPATMLDVPGAAYAEPSRDGRIVFTKTDAQGERIYVGMIERPNEATLLITSPGAVPTWSPDNRQIAYSGDRSFTQGIFVINSDGTGQRRLTPDGGWPVWFPDGRRIGYLALGARGNQEYREVDVRSGATRVIPVPLRGTNMPFFPTPDGRGLVYSNSVHVSDEIWLLKPAPAGRD